MNDTRGRRSETEPLEYHGEPLSRLEPIDLTAEPEAYVMLTPGWEERLKELTPRGTLYPEAATWSPEAAARVAAWLAAWAASHPQGEDA